MTRAVDDGEAFGLVAMRVRAVFCGGLTCWQLVLVVAVAFVADAGGDDDVSMEDRCCRLWR